MTKTTTLSMEQLEHRFMHESCDIFAEALVHKYQYKIESLLSEDDGFPLHIYCIAECDDTKYFIDMRGCLSDWDEFIGPFKSLMKETNREKLIAEGLLIDGNFNNPKERSYDYSNGTLYERNTYHLAELYLTKKYLVGGKR